MELRNLNTFITVCESMNLSKAADKLGYVQSTVTAQINQLEQELGVPLFDRIGKRLTLNQKGTELLEYAYRIISLEKEARDDIADRGTPKGLLRVGVIESVGTVLMPVVISSYVRKYPAVNVQVCTGTTRMIMDMLKQGKVDLIFTFDDKVSETGWQCAAQLEDDIVFLCAPEHSFSGRKNVRLEEILKENIILTEAHCNYRRSFEHHCNVQGYSIGSFTEIGSTNTIIQFVSQGLGVSFLPEFTVRHQLEKGKFSTFEIESVNISMLLQVIYNSNKWYSPAMKAFIEEIKEGCLL